jgi:hypothetical protein
LSWEVWTGRFGEWKKKEIVRIHEEEDGGGRCDDCVQSPLRKELRESDGY